MTSFLCYKNITGRKKIVVKKDNIYYLLDYFHKKKRSNLVFSETAISVNKTITIKIPDMKSCLQTFKTKIHIGLTLNK